MVSWFESKRGNQDGESMATPAGTAQQEWVTTSGTDFLQLKSASGGNVLGWIDSTGAGQGALASGSSSSPVASVSLQLQGASIGTTNLIVSPNPNFLYQISYYLYVDTQGTGGTVSLTLGWSAGGAQINSSGNAQCNTLGSNRESTIPVIKSPGGAITYSTTYSGTGGATYSLDIRVFSLS
jgi:hypothetical protein